MTTAMTKGQMFIIENVDIPNGIMELSYEKAIEQAYKELNEKGVICSMNVYDCEDIITEPIYPLNAELYDEFCDEQGFMLEEFYCFVCRYMFH